MNAQFTIVGIGEVLWDMLPSGPQMGGAPANFTCHARALGVWTDCIGVDALRPTGTVSVELDAGQPRYIIHENVAWDFLEATPCSRAAAGAADAVCFGTLAQRGESSRHAIRALVAAAPHALRVCDVNLRQHFHSREILADSLALANVVKLNDAELPILSAHFALPGDTRAQLAALAARFELELLVLTRGAHGSLLHDGAQWSEHPGIFCEVKDTIGAGDSFTAATVLGYLSAWPLDRINAFANEVAAYVCSQSGATPPLPEHLLALGR